MAHVTNVYLHVIDDVVKNVQADFQSEGMDDSVLQELQALWEQKLLQSGAILAPPSEADNHARNDASRASHMNMRTGIMAAHDLNMPYIPADEEFRTRELLQAASAPHRGQQPLHAQYGSMPFPNSGRGRMDLEPTLGRPQPYLPKPEHWEHKPSGGVDLNNALEPDADDDNEGDGVTQDFFSVERKRRRLDGANQGYIPQVDGGNDEDAGRRLQGAPSSSSAASGMNEDRWLKKWKAMVKRRHCIDADRKDEGDAVAEFRPASAGGIGCIPQVDGEDDEDAYEDDGAPEEDELPEEEAEEEDYNEPGETTDPAPVEPAPAVPREEAEEEEDDEPPLGADDDEDDVDDPNSSSEDPVTDHYVLATYDKVTRSKNKWKCVLKDGIMHLNGKDILFYRANGEFEF